MNAFAIGHDDLKFCEDKLILQNKRALRNANWSTQTLIESSWFIQFFLCKNGDLFLKLGDKKCSFYH